MAHRLYIRFWLESITAGLAAVLGIVTLFWKDWIEAVFGIDPDNNSGAVEWLLVIALFTVAGLLGCTARTEWRSRQRLTVAPQEQPPTS